MFKFSETSLSRMEGVDRRLIAVAKTAIQVSKIDFGIPADGGVRTAQRQAELFAAGKSKADGIHNKSRHQSGTALDVYAYVDGKASWEPEHLTLVATAMLQSASIVGYAVEWGGLWRTFLDMPHFQLRNA